jgi:ribonuclease R
VAARLMAQNLKAIYRIHEEPAEKRLQEYREDVLSHNVPCGNLNNRLEVQRLLQKLGTIPIGQALKIGFLKSLMRARYAIEPLGHYGLAKKKYAHFTSPIRRYADLVVHRVFDTYLGKSQGKPTASYRIAQIDNLAEHLSLTEINSTEAERDSQKLKLMEYFERESEKKHKTVFTAIITDVRNHGFFIEVADAGAFGMVPVSTLKDDFYVLNGAGTAFIGRKTKRKFELGHKVQVVVAKVDRQKRLIDFTVP